MDSFVEFFLETRVPFFFLLTDIFSLSIYLSSIIHRSVINLRLTSLLPLRASFGSSKITDRSITFQYFKHNSQEKSSFEEVDDTELSKYTMILIDVYGNLFFLSVIIYSVYGHPLRFALTCATRSFLNKTCNVFAHHLLQCCVLFIYRLQVTLRPTVHRSFLLESNFF